MYDCLWGDGNRHHTRRSRLTARLGLVPAVILDAVALWYGDLRSESPHRSAAIRPLGLGALVQRLGIFAPPLHNHTPYITPMYPINDEVRPPLFLRPSVLACLHCIPLYGRILGQAAVIARLCRPVCGHGVYRTILGQTER